MRGPDSRRASPEAHARQGEVTGELQGKSNRPASPVLGAAGHGRRVGRAAGLFKGGLPGSLAFTTSPPYEDLMRLMLSVPNARELGAGGGGLLGNDAKYHAAGCRCWMLTCMLQGGCRATKTEQKALQLHCYRHLSLCQRYSVCTVHESSSKRRTNNLH